MSKNSHADHRTKSHRQTSGKKTPQVQAANADETKGVVEEKKIPVQTVEEHPAVRTGESVTENIHTNTMRALPPGPKRLALPAGPKMLALPPGETHLALPAKEPEPKKPAAEEGGPFKKVGYGYNMFKSAKAFNEGYHEKGKDGGVKGGLIKGGHEALGSVVQDGLSSSKATHIKDIGQVKEEFLKTHKEFWGPIAEKTKTGFNRIVHGKGAAAAVVEGGEHAKQEGGLVKGLWKNAAGKASEKFGEFKGKLSTAEGRGGLVKGGVNSLGQAGLSESFQTAGGELIQYRTGKKAYTAENGADSTIKTVMALDPFHAVAKMIPIKGSDHISIERGISHLTGNHGQTLSEMGDETMRQYKHANDIAAGAAYHRKPKTTKAPLMTDYAHLAAVAPQIAKFIPGGKIDGHDVVKEFSKIDMTQSKNYHAYNRALLQAVVEQDQIMQANRSYIPRTMRFGAGADRFNEAETQSSLLAAAQEENGQFLARIHAYNKAHALEVAQMQAAAAMKKDPKHPAQGKDADHDHVTPGHALPPVHKQNTIAA